MKTYLTIDGGTTNTRISIVCDRHIVDTVKLSIGAGKAADDKSLYVTSIRDGIQAVLERNAILSENVTAVIASGMITSEYGLCNLPHINAPACLCDLHNSMHRCDITEITNIPFFFVRGVKCEGISFADTDIMRGEETELMGIFCPEYGKCVYVLPGSHSKIISADDCGRIVDFSTMLTGEMTAALSKSTILKDAVDLDIDTFDENYLLKGYNFCFEQGINKSLFKVRILKNVFKCTPVEIYSFFMGIILCDEIKCILKSEADSIVLAGKAQLKKAMAYILENISDRKVIVLDEAVANSSTALGAVRIFENKI